MLGFLLFDLVKDFFAVDGNGLGCSHANAYLISLNPQNGNLDVITDVNCFARCACQY